MGLLNVELCDKSVPHEPPEIVISAVCTLCTSIGGLRQ